MRSGGLLQCGRDEALSRFPRVTLEKSACWTNAPRAIECDSAVTPTTAWALALLTRFLRALFSCRIGPGALALDIDTRSIPWQRNSCFGCTGGLSRQDAVYSDDWNSCCQEPSGDQRTACVVSRPLARRRSMLCLAPQWSLAADGPELSGEPWEGDCTVFPQRKEIHHLTACADGEAVLLGTCLVFEELPNELAVSRSSTPFDPKPVARGNQSLSARCRVPF